jgi:Family of unknown function (DUF5317)
MAAAAVAIILGAGLSAADGAIGTVAGVAGPVVGALCVVAVLARNRRIEGVPLLAAGLLLNVVVIAANGAMPVSRYAEERAGVDRDTFVHGTSGAHEVADDQTRLSLLADVIPVALPVRPETVSAGDVLIVSGVGLLIVAGMHRRSEGV